MMKREKKWFLLPWAAMAITFGSALVSYAATGWSQDNGEWTYLNSDGSQATDVFKKSGNHWYYLDDSGSMAKDTLIESDDNYYYVNEDGVMVTGQWLALDNEESSEDEPQQWWYYFQTSGKAIKRSGSSDKVKFSTISTSTGDAKFTFDDEGHMLYGWLDENGERLTGDDAWQSGVYYCDDNGSGRLATGWKYIEAVNDEDKNRDGDGYWFFFTNNGRKTVDKDSKKINGRKYSFDQYGAASFDWYSNPASPGNGTASASSPLRYYNTEEQCWISTGWFKAIPDETADPEGYDDGELRWFYADSSGDLARSEIKKINGQSYGFDPYGKMLHGLYMIEFEENGKTIRSAVEIKEEEDLPDEDEAVFVYYFGDSPKEGSVKTGTAAIEISGEKYSYSFLKSGSKKGAGTDGIDGDSIYIKGRMLKAEAGTKYQPVTYKDETYLISTAGKLVKNKKNVKDSDDVYYKTDSKGRVLETGTEKLE